MESFQFVTILFILFTFSRVLLRYKKREISFSEFFFWTGLWLFILVLAIQPDTMTFLLGRFGVGRPIDVLVYGSLLAIFYLIFRVYVHVDNLERSITLMTRKQAIATAQHPHETRAGGD